METPNGTMLADLKKIYGDEEGRNRMLDLLLNREPVLGSDLASGSPHMNRALRALDKLKELEEPA